MAGSPTGPGEHHAAALSPGTSPGLRARELGRLSVSGMTEMPSNMLYYYAPTSPPHLRPPPIGGRTGFKVKAKTAPPTRSRKIHDETGESPGPLRKTLNHMLEGGLIVGFDWRVNYVNDAFTRAGRRTKQDMLGHTMEEINPDIVETEFYAHFRRCMEERVPHRGKSEFSYPDSSRAVYDVSIEPVPEGVLILSLDVTAEKHAEELLKESETSLRGALNNLLEGCLIVGFNWRYLFANDAVLRRGKRTSEELLGHTMMEVNPDIVDTEFFASCRRCMEERIPHRMETELTYPNGPKVWADVSIQPVPKGIFILSLDISRRKRTEEALEATRDDLEAKVERQFLRRNPYGLTFRELTVLHLVAAGESDRQIALTLGISLRTAQQHVSKILSKMNVRSRTKAGVRAIRVGLLN